MNPGEVELYAARAEVHPLMRTRTGLFLNPQGRAMKARIAEAFSEGIAASVELEIARSIAERGLEHTSELIDLAISKSEGNEFKFRTLLPIVFGYRQTVTRAQRRLIDPFAL